MSDQKVTVQNLYKDLRNSIESLTNDKSSISASRQIVEEALQKDEAFYGINTGFGALANPQRDIPADDATKNSRPGAGKLRYISGDI